MHCLDHIKENCLRKRNGPPFFDAIMTGSVKTFLVYLTDINSNSKLLKEQLTVYTNVILSTLPKLQRTDKKKNSINVFTNFSFRQIVGDSNLAKKFDVRIFCFRYAETINGPKNHFVHEVAPFPKSGHILQSGLFSQMLSQINI